MTNQTRITPLHFFVLTITITFGTSILTMPRKLAEIAGEDMWMPILLGSLLIVFSFWTSLRLAAYYPQHTSAHFHCLLVGPVLGTLLNIYLLVLMISITSVFLRTFIIAIKVNLLDLTPSTVLLALLLIPAIYAVQYGLNPVLRTAQFLLLPAYGSFIALILLGFLSVNTNNFQPVLAEGFKPVLLGVPSTWLCYTGIELMTGLLYKNITRPKSIFKFGAAAIAVITSLYLLITLITQGILGPQDTKHLLIPTVMAYRSVEIPDTFVERLDGYLMIIWIAVCFNAQIGWIYLSTSLIKQMFRLEYARPVIPLLVPVIMYFVLLPPDIQTVNKFISWTNLAGLIWGLLILPLLLVLAKIKGRNKDKC